MPFDRRRSGVPIDEFKALVSATFDNIGNPHLDLDSHADFLALDSPPSSADAVMEHNEVDTDDDATPRPLRPQSGVPRHSAFSFLRKVKSQATSLVHDAVHGHPTPAAQETYAVISDKASASFSPEPNSTTPTPIGRSRSKSLPRSLLAFGLVAQPTEKPPPVPVLPKHVEAGSTPLLHSFFEHDRDANVTPSPPARLSARPPAMRRLSAIFDASINSDSALVATKAPSVLSGDSAGLARPESRVISGPKLSLTTKLRTKISRSRLSPFASSASSHTVTPFPYTPASESLPTPTLYYSPYSDKPSPVTPASSSFPLSPASPAFDDARRYEALRQGRAMTPEDDPFRKGALVYAGENTWHFVGVSPQRRSYQASTNGPTRKQVQKSRSTPKLSSRWSSDSDSLPPSPTRAPSSNKPLRARGSYTHGDRIPFPVYGTQSPMSFTFPLPPGSQDGAGADVVTVRVTTPLPGPPPSYPPPSLPPPDRPLPRTPHTSPLRRIISGKVLSSPKMNRDSSGRSRSKREIDRALSKPLASLYRRRSHTKADRSSRAGPAHPISKVSSPAIPSLQPESPARPSASSTVSTPSLSSAHSRSRVQSCTDSVVNELLDLCESEGSGLQFTNPWTDGAGDAGGDVAPDSDIEPDWSFEVEAASMKKKASVASAASMESSTSTASAVTATSSRSGATVSTAATTVSASNSPLTDLGGTLELFPKLSPRYSIHRVQRSVAIDYEDGLERAETYYSARSRPVSNSEADVAAHAVGLYTLQADGLLRNIVPRALIFSDNEKITLGASGWIEFRNLSENHGNTVPVRMLDEAEADVEVEVVEILRDGTMCGVEVTLAAYPEPDDDFDVDGPIAIPGSYPGHPSQLRGAPAPYPIIPRRHSLSIPGQLGQGVLSHIPLMSAIDIPYRASSTSPSEWSPGLGLGALGLEGVPPLADVGSISPPSPAPSFEYVPSDPVTDRSLSGSSTPADIPWEIEGVRRRVLAFRMPLPTTLCELARRAGERSLLEGVVAETPRSPSSAWWF